MPQDDDLPIIRRQRQERGLHSLPPLFDLQRVDRLRRGNRLRHLFTRCRALNVLSFS